MNDTYQTKTSQCIHKYVTPDSDYSNSGTLSITIAVEGGYCPAICLCAQTPHKLAAGWAPQDWSQEWIQLDKVLDVKTTKNTWRTKGP